MIALGSNHNKKAEEVHVHLILIAVAKNADCTVYGIAAEPSPTYNCIQQESLANAKVARRATALHVKNGFWREIGT